jgi:cephalosporin hydroxylase
MTMNEQFERERIADIAKMEADGIGRASAIDFIVKTAPYRYAYNFSWMGRPIIQFPQDMVAMQQIIWETKPDLIIETGIAHGGSIIYYASLMEMMSLPGKIIGIDIDIRPHNRSAIEQHPMAHRLDLIEGSSIDESTVAEVHRRAGNAERVLVILDSNHTHDHVLAEMRAYSGLVTKGSYLVVFDTVVEDMPTGWFVDRDWDVGNNPKTAVRQFLQESDRFAVDASIDQRILISVAPGGYLRCLS